MTGVGKPEHVAPTRRRSSPRRARPRPSSTAPRSCTGARARSWPGDVVVAISNSGETRGAPRGGRGGARLGARVVAVTGDPASWLARAADAVLDAGVAREGGGLGLAPRASVAAELLVLAALSAALEEALRLHPPRLPRAPPGGRARREEPELTRRVASPSRRSKRFAAGFRRGAAPAAGEAPARRLRPWPPPSALEREDRARAGSGP